MKIGSRTYTAHTDVQGTVWAFSDEQENVAAVFGYDAWGNVLSRTYAPGAEALAGVRYGFQGREHSRLTGFIHFRMRWYDPVTGRWLSKDPIRLLGGMNLYALCGCDPVNSVDVDGLFLIPIFVPEIVKVGAFVGRTVLGSKIVSELIAHFSKKLFDTSSYFKPKGGHTKNARKSTRQKHDQADARRKREQENSRRRKEERLFPIPDDAHREDVCE